MNGLKNTSLLNLRPFRMDFRLIGFIQSQNGLDIKVIKINNSDIKLSKRQKHINIFSCLIDPP